MAQLIHFIRSGGIVMIPLLLLSLVGIAIIVDRLLAFRTLGHTAPGLLSTVLHLARDGQHAEAQRRCEATPGPLAAALATVLQYRHRPVEVVERKVEEVGQEFFIKLEKGLPFLDTTTTISPLLGLLGTVVGMIGTFNALGVQQAGGNSDAVLAGVAEALYATATGITIAVVCFVAYNYFAARLCAVTAETEQAATKLINALSEEGVNGFGGQEAQRAVQTAA